MKRNVIASGINFYVTLTCLFLLNFFVYPSESENKVPTAMPGETESHLMFRTGVFFLEIKNMPDSAITYFLSAKELDDIDLNDSIYYYLAECYLGLDNPETALGAHFSINDSLGFNAKFLYQRYRIFKTFGMEDDALALFEQIITLYPESEETAFLLSIVVPQETSKDRSVLKPSLYVTSKEKYTSRNFDADNMNEVISKNLGEFSSQEWKTFVKTAFQWNFNTSAASSINIRPWFRITAPTQSFSDASHYVALDINYLFAQTEKIFLELTCSYTDQIQRGTAPFHEFSLGWVISHAGDNLNVFSNSVTASYLHSGNGGNNGFYSSILLSRLPLLSLGSKSALNGWLLGTFSSFKAQENPLPSVKLYGNGATEGNLIGSSILYSDSTFTDSVKTVLSYETDKRSRNSEGRVLGEFIPARVVAGILGLDFNFVVKNWLLLNLEGQYETNFYIDTYRFDNAHYGTINSNGQTYIFLNRSDNLEYLIRELSNESESAPSIYRFEKYKSVKKRRWDNTFMIRPGIDIKPVQWMTVKIYAEIVRDIISFIGNEEHRYANNEINPGFECSFRF